MPKIEPRLREEVTESFRKDLRTALTCPREVLRDLSSRLDKDRGFRLLDEQQIMRIWSEADLVPDTLPATFKVLKYIFDFGCMHGWSVDDLLAEVREICARSEIPGFEERQEELRSILSPSQRYLERRRALPWSRGVFPVLVGIDANVELRGVFEESSGPDRPTGVIPLAILRLAVKYDDEEKAQIRRIAMQLTEEDVDKIISSLQRSKTRLKQLKGLAKSGNMEFFDDVLAGQWSDSDEQE